MYQNGLEPWPLPSKGIPRSVPGLLEGAEAERGRADFRVPAKEPAGKGSGLAVAPVRYLDPVLFIGQEDGFLRANVGRGRAERIAYGRAGAAGQRAGLRRCKQPRPVQPGILRKASVFAELLRYCRAREHDQEKHDSVTSSFHASAPSCGLTEFAELPIHSHFGPTQRRFERVRHR